MSSSTRCGRSRSRKRGSSSSPDGRQSSSPTRSSAASRRRDPHPRRPALRASAPTQPVRLPFRHHVSLRAARCRGSRCDSLHLELDLDGRRLRRLPVGRSRQARVGPSEAQEAQLDSRRHRIEDFPHARIRRLYRLHPEDVFSVKRVVVIGGVLPARPRRGLCPHACLAIRQGASLRLPPSRFSRPKTRPRTLATTTPSSPAKPAFAPREPRWVWDPLDRGVTGLAFGHPGRYAVGLTGGLIVSPTGDRPRRFPARSSVTSSPISATAMSTLTYSTLALWYAFLSRLGHPLRGHPPRRGHILPSLSLDHLAPRCALAAARLPDAECRAALARDLRRRPRLRRRRPGRRPLSRARGAAGARRRLGRAPSAAPSRSRSPASGAR